MIIFNIFNILSHKLYIILIFFYRYRNILINTFFRTLIISKKYLYLINTILYNIFMLFIAIISIAILLIYAFIIIEKHFLSCSILNITFNCEFKIITFLIKELSPILITMLFIDKSNHILFKEIKLIKTNKNTTCLKNKKNEYLYTIIIPYFWASIICIPLLTLIFIFIGIIGNILIDINWKSFNENIFFYIIKNIIYYKFDILHNCVKSIIFALSINWVTIINNYNCSLKLEKIINANNKTIIYSLISILLINCVLTYLIF
uniref:Uncharacterized protein n=1 Tax=Candidatus Aschnera chinzeii TaxID=1485666 RepID=A0AAT9G4G6_9ENTR|nr:MAG: hypothetical protein ACHINZ_2880 [Candidatus Aschnera chinzeii]